MNAYTEYGRYFLATNGYVDIIDDPNIELAFNSSPVCPVPLASFYEIGFIVFRYPSDRDNYLTKRHKANVTLLIRDIKKYFNLVDS